MEFDAFREIFRSPSVVHGVVAEGFGEGFSDGFGFVGERDFDSFDKDVGVSAAEAGFAFVLLGVRGRATANVSVSNLSVCRKNSGARVA